MDKKIEERFQYKAGNDIWAYDIWEKHENLHWLPREVSLGKDTQDWNNLSKEDKDFLTKIMGFFTQADIEVHDTYLDCYLPHYKTLGVKQMLTGFSARECVHIMGYAYIVEELIKGKAQDEVFSAFIDVPALRRIHDAFEKYSDTSTVENRYKNMIATTLFGEGVMLFGQFAMLLNYAYQGKMTGVGQIVSWSIRDEDMHVYGVTQLMKRDAEFNAIPLQRRQEIYSYMYWEFMPLIQDFVSYCYEALPQEGSSVKPLEFTEILEFLDFQAGRRARQVGLKELYQGTNHFPWFDMMIAGVEHANFFEQRATEYSKGNLIGEFFPVKEEGAE